MRHALIRINLLLAGLALFMGGCGGSINVWPFGEGKTANGPRGPENATEYRCEGGKTFYLRMLDAGKSAWVILPDRQVGLDKVAADSGSRYSNGIAVLKIDGAEVSLADGAAIAYVGCKAPTTGGRQ